MAEYKQQTHAVKSGIGEDHQFGAVVPPIYLSTNYTFAGYGEKRQYDYSRSGNPTRDTLGHALAALEGGAGCVITGTGMGAVNLVASALLQAGDLLVAPHDCYGGTYRLFQHVAARGNYRVLFVDQGDGEALAAALAQSASEAVAKLGALVGLDSLMAGILRRLRCSVSGLQGIPCVATSLHHS